MALRVINRCGKSPLFLIFIFSVLTSIGCARRSGSSLVGRSGLLCNSGPTPVAYCDTVRSYASGVTISGSALYEARELDANGLGAPGLPRPIRFAEVTVVDGLGDTVQCGQTDSAGNFAVIVPQGSHTYTVSVKSRGKNEKVNAQVFNRPEQKQAYSISKSFTPNQSQALDPLVAPATENLEGGAFNIFDQIVAANEFLRTEVGNCGFASCPNFTVAPNVDVYWEKGFNPGSYVNQGPVSFYMPGQSCLFILGGLNGNVNEADTDHFDNSVIIHEYGHFIEDVMTDTDSPGGPHSGNKQIDPRLAWGEGWGNFFQAAVLNSPYYIDTEGNIDGDTNYIFKIPLEDADPQCASEPYTPGCDVPSETYEGHFREFAITRFLWDLFDDDGGVRGNDSDGDSTNAAFAELWAILRWNEGLLDPDVAFRSIGLIHYAQINRLPSHTDWSATRTSHHHGTDRLEYANYVTRNGACGPQNFTINPMEDPGDNGTYATSDLLRNNDFFHYKHPGGAVNLVLSYQTPSGQESDLDLYIYKEDYTYGDSATMAASSQEYFDNNTSTAETETVSIEGLTAGNYLINVKVYTGTNTESGCLGSICTGQYIPAGDTTNYDLTLNGVTLCPTSLP